MKHINDYGYFEMTLDELLKEKGISKNYLAEHANLQRTQLNTYCKGNIKRPDFEVLARICYVLNCEISDIVRYVHPTVENGGENNG